MPTKDKTHITAGNVERTKVGGRTVWRVHSVKSGRVLSVTASSSSGRSMKNTKVRYGKALKSLADR